MLRLTLLKELSNTLFKTGRIVGNHHLQRRNVVQCDHRVQTFTPLRTFEKWMKLWTEMNVALFFQLQKLIDIMPQQTHAVIRVKGGPTKYYIYYIILYRVCDFFFGRAVYIATQISTHQGISSTWVHEYLSSFLSWAKLFELKLYLWGGFWILHTVSHSHTCL